MTLFADRGCSFTVYQIEAMPTQSNQQFLNDIEDAYGSTEDLAKILDLGIEMLFYLEENTFARREVQEVVSALRIMISVLRSKD
ncbi:MAG: hypothetical protein AAFU57_09345 [Bacteroidota bacterium]